MAKKEVESKLHEHSVTAASDREPGEESQSDSVWSVPLAMLNQLRGCLALEIAKAKNTRRCSRESGR